MSCWKSQREIWFIIRCRTLKIQNITSTWVAVGGKPKQIFLVKRNSGEIQSKNQCEHLKPIWFSNSFIFVWKQYILILFQSITMIFTIAETGNGMKKHTYTSWIEWFFINTIERANNAIRLVLSEKALPFRHNTDAENYELDHIFPFNMVAI